MKLNESRPYLESSGELEEQFFAIQDQGMLFDILRKKMYSNPILAICREISCNARDAHREVGTPEVPVHIHLPNNLEPYYKIRDFGPGISPERMSNVFIKYTASTKRESNVQTGGFGLGAKTPFSYSDSFSIVTVHDGIRYNYNCVIDETKVGKLMLTSEAPTKEKNGTEIMIPVLPKNFNDFRIYTEQACRHWDVKPTIKGDRIEWQKLTSTLAGNNWAIAANHNYANKDAKMIIDGIEYPLDLTSLRNYADAKLIDAAHGHFIMYFGVGELSLSASREQIYLDEKTQGIIRARLEAISLELRQRAVEKINEFTNFWDANVYYNKELRASFNNLGFLGALAWQGIPLIDHSFAITCPVFTFSKGKYSRKHGTDPNKLSRSSATNHIAFDKNAVIFVNDLSIKEPTPRHVKKAFEDDLTLKTLHVICPTDKVTRAILDTKFNLDKMTPKVLSTITKASGRAYTPAASRLLVFKFDPRSTHFRQVSYASIDEDTNGKVLCVLHRDTHTGVRNAVLKTKEHLTYSSIKTLMAKFPKFSFYGIDEGTDATRIKEDFSDFEQVDSFIKEKVFDNKSIDYTKIKFANSHQSDIDNKMLPVHLLMKTLIKRNDSFFFEWMNLQQRLKELGTADLGLLTIYESVHGAITDVELKKFAKAHPELDIEEMNLKFEKRYPLLEHINVWNYKDIVEDLAEYINLVDSCKGKENV